MPGAVSEHGCPSLVPPEVGKLRVRRGLRTRRRESAPGALCPKPKVARGTLALGTLEAPPEGPPAGTQQELQTAIPGNTNPRCHPDIRVLHPDPQPSWDLLPPRGSPSRRLPTGMFQGSRTSIPKPAPRNLEELDSVQRVLLHRSVQLPGCSQAGWRGGVRLGAGLPSRSRCSSAGSLTVQPRANQLHEAPLYREGKGPSGSQAVFQAPLHFLQAGVGEAENFAYSL